MIKHCILILLAVFSSAEETTISSNSTTLYPVPTNTPKNETLEPIFTQESTAKPLKIDTMPTLQAKELSTTWKIEASFTKSNLTEDDIETELKENSEAINEVKEFKPSPHLGSFFDEESAEIIKEPIVTPVTRPLTSFVSSPKDVFKASFKKPPKKIFETHQMFPYKFETPFYTRAKGNWLSEDIIESKPTIQVPVETPAEEFYKVPESFIDRPLNSEEYMPNTYEEGKDIIASKRNPWTSLLQLLTAFLPVGLIFSALAPNVITIDSIGTGSQYPSNPFRRSESGIEDVGPLSEECRRRLLCELRSEISYGSSSEAPKKKHCYKIFCENLGPLWRILKWLLSHQPIGFNDQRARIIS